MDVLIPNISQEEEILLKNSRTLQGIFLTKFIDDQLEDRQQVLDVPSEVKSSQLAFSDTLIKQFSSSYEECKFKKAVDILGHSIPASTSFPVYSNVTIDPSQCKSSDEMQCKFTQYSATIKSSVLHAASYFFKCSNLKFSQSALTELRQLLSIVKNHGEFSSNTQDRCRHFFTLYGSHVSLGPLAFGGYFLWTCSSKEFQETQMESVKIMQKKCLSSNAGLEIVRSGISAEVNFDDVKYAFKGTSLEHTVGNTTLEVKVHGGPPKASSIGDWKQKLIANKNTWVLIDRGKCLISVWDIINLSYKTEFGKLAKILRWSWEVVTGLSSEKHLVEVSHRSELVLETVSELYEEKEELTPELIYDTLKYLLKVKKSFAGVTGTSMFWISEILTNVKFQEFLAFVMNFEKGSSTVYDNIKFALLELVKQEELNQLDTRNFKTISNCYAWISLKEQQNFLDELQKNVVNVASFVEYLKAIVSLIPMSYSQFCHNELAKDAEVVIKKLQQKYHKAYEHIFTMILLFPYQCTNVNDVIQLKPLSLLSMVQVQDSFSIEIKNFDMYKNNIIHLQSYLLLLAVQKTPMVFLETMINHIIAIMKELSPSLENQFLLELKQSLHYSSFIITFVPLLQSSLKSADCSSAVNAESLAIYLQSNGLYNTNFWLAELKQLGVTSSASFKLLEGNFAIYSQLEDKTTFDVEKKIFQNILKINKEMELAGESKESLQSLQHILQQVRSIQMLPPSEEPFVLWDNNPEVYSMLDSMGLSIFYPKKLRLKDSLCISEDILKLSLSDVSPTDPKQLPYLVLHRILSYDSGFLSNIDHRSGFQ